MKANEIREHMFPMWVKRGTEVRVVPIPTHGSIMPLESDESVVGFVNDEQRQEFWLREIAAQLAEMNERAK